MRKIERDSFIMYRSFFESIQWLDKNVIADVFTAICEYSLNGKEVELEWIAKNIFILIKPQLEANNKKYLNWKQGWRPEKNWENSEKPKQNQNESKIKPKDNQNKTKLKPNDKCIMYNEEWIMYNEEWEINNELFSNENNSEAEIVKDEEVNSLSIVDDSKEKEKSSAKKEKESYGREDINYLIEQIKIKCNILWVMYDKTKEREFAKHILTAKEYWENCERCRMNRVDFAINIIQASKIINYYKWICNWPMSIYQYYVDVYNRYMQWKEKQNKMVWFLPWIKTQQWQN